MSAEYRHREIEQKWQEIWNENPPYQAVDFDSKPKKYVLVMFPYPSGPLHMGHVRNYSIGDLIARYYRMKGFNVIHPIGYDAFGLPAENAAIERGANPKDWTLSNISIMREQLKQLGISYDWEREVITCLPDYYRWGQWIFLQFYKRGLAYKKEAPVNWCPGCETVLANEQVEDGKCWRCGAEVIKKKLDQWFFKITDYAERLLNDLSLLEGWPERVRVMQRNWIGRSEGAEVNFELEDGRKIPVFTTRPDTLFGVTFFVLAPEHPLSYEICSETGKLDELENMIKEAQKITSIEREEDAFEKKGFFTGKYVINPVNGDRVPVWIANYVLMEYGTGAVMGVPAHDQRDYDFAVKYDIPIKTVIAPEDLSEDERMKFDVRSLGHAFEEEGIMINSGDFDGLKNREGIKKITEYLESTGKGRKAVSYRLRDWLISRQRYWGNPIPIVYCKKCGIVPVPEDQLPVLLPEPEKVDFSLKGVSPLSSVEEFVNTECPKCGGPARRETDTMDTFTCSSWYFLRYCSPHNEDAAWDVDKANYWMPVDQYIGGIEHAILHLLYSRFFMKVFYDMDLVNYAEPFTNLLTQGMITKDGAKMSKSKGNVVSPEDMINKYGADATRLFILFAAPPEKDLEWSDRGVQGAYRFVRRVYRMASEIVSLEGYSKDLSISNETHELTALDRKLISKLHLTIRNVTRDIEKDFGFNTAISSMMELSNELEEYLKSENPKASVALEVIKNLVIMLAPIAPHLSEEVWHMLGYEYSVHKQPWPEYSEMHLDSGTVEIVVQINGKVRDRITVEKGISQEMLVELIMKNSKAGEMIKGKEIRKTIFVPDKLINFVV